jgi:hypothetical protein
MMDVAINPSGTKVYLMDNSSLMTVVSTIKEAVDFIDHEASRVESDEKCRELLRFKERLRNLQEEYGGEKIVTVTSRDIAFVAKTQEHYRIFAEACDNRGDPKSAGIFRKQEFYAQQFLTRLNA